LVAGDYEFRAVYSGDSNYTGSMSGADAEPLLVKSMFPSHCIVLGQSVTDNATVTGLGFPFAGPTGTVDFQVSYNNSNVWTSYDAGVVLVNGNATSTWYTPMATGHYNFRAIYSGDANYHSSQSGIAEEPLCVFPACTTTFTLLSSTSIILGQSVTDQVVVSGLGGMFPVPSGTVDFQVQVGTGLWATYDTETLSVLGTDGVATSIAYMPLTVTSYNFRAIYNGDHNYLSSQSQNGDEPLAVHPGIGVSPITTLLSQTTITLGDSVTDTATVPGMGVSFSAPTGSVEFQVQIGNGLWATYDTESLSAQGANGIATSIVYTPMTVDSYNFRAIYMGDVNYQGSQSGDAAEPLIVVAAQTCTTTVLGAESIILGNSVTDNATVNALGEGFPTPSGSVDFQVSVNDGAWETYNGNVALVDGTATSIWYMPQVAGDYNFRAVYSGDSNYVGSSSGYCAEPLNVKPATPCTTTILGVSSIMMGQSVTDNATVTGLGSPFAGPTGTVDFQVRNVGGNWMVFDAGVVLVDGSATSTFYMPTAAGNYQFQAVYNSDNNYDSSKSCPFSEPLCVKQAPTETCTCLGVTSIVMGQSVTDNATVSGMFGTPTGTVDFQVKYNSGDWSVFDAGVVLVDGSAT
jgi:hypothetical protein